MKIIQAELNFIKGIIIVLIKDKYSANDLGELLGLTKLYVVIILRILVKISREICPSYTVCKIILGLTRDYIHLYKSILLKLIIQILFYIYLKKYK